MVDYADSSQLNKWLFANPEELAACRSKTNRNACILLGSSTPPSEPPLAEHFGAGFSRAVLQGKERGSIELMEAEGMAVPTGTADGGHAFLTPEEEATLVSFYASKLPSLIGPNAQVQRLRRDAKVTATAALFLRRFFLSNSVQLYDPKAIMVAAAFLGSKVEDATADIRYLEEGTTLMNAPVPMADILVAEVALIQGLNFELRCFHPYKALVALTEDLRTFFKTAAGQKLVETPITGQELAPLYESSRQLVDRIILSDIPLLYSPGQIGMAALMVSVAQQNEITQLNLMSYLRVRFPDQEVPAAVLEELCSRLRRLEDHGFLDDKSVNMQALKGIHKKLKKVRIWGKKSSKEKSNKRQKVE